MFDYIIVAGNDYYSFREKHAELCVKHELYQLVFDIWLLNDKMKLLMILLLRSTENGCYGIIH